VSRPTRAHGGLTAVGSAQPRGSLRQLVGLRTPNSGVALIRSTPICGTFFGRTSTFCRCVGALIETPAVVGSLSARDKHVATTYGQRSTTGVSKLGVTWDTQEPADQRTEAVYVRNVEVVGSSPITFTPKAHVPLRLPRESHIASRFPLRSIARTQRRRRPLLGDWLVTVGVQWRARKNALKKTLLQVGCP